MKLFQTGRGKLYTSFAATYAAIVGSLALVLVISSTPMWKWNADNPGGILSQRHVLVEGDFELAGELRMRGIDTVRCEDLSPSGEVLFIGSEEYTEVNSMSTYNHMWKSSAKREKQAKLSDGLLSFLSPECNVLEPDVLHLGQLLVETTENGLSHSGQFLDNVKRLAFVSSATASKHGLLHFNFTNLLENLPECAKTIELPRAVYPSVSGVNAVDIEQMLIRLVIAVQELSAELDRIKAT